MRKLVWFSIGFAAACVLGISCMQGLLLAGSGLLCLLVAGALRLLRNKPAAIIAMVLFGCAAGLLWNWGYDRIYLNTARGYDGQTVELEVEITDYSFDTGYCTAADGGIMLDGKFYRVRLYVYESDSLSPGDKVTGKMRLTYTANGGAEEATYHKGEGIFLKLRADDELTVLHPEEVPARYFIASFRRTLSERIVSVFPEDTAPFALAVLLGNDNLFTVQEDAAFQVSGIRHVVAVSGLHVSVLFAVLFFLTRKQKFLTAILGLPLLAFFAAIAGFTPSVVRACVMQGLMILGLLLDKEYDPPTSLAFAVLVMLAINPITITSVSFQLSVACMIGIFAFSQRIRRFLLRKCERLASKNPILAKSVKWATGTVSVTLGAMITTMPLCAWYFGLVSLIGILTNLLTLWVVSGILFGIMLVCVLSFIWMPLAHIAAYVIAWPIRYVLWVARALWKVPFAAIYTDSVYTVLWIVSVYILLGVFFLSRKKRPCILCGCAVGLLCLSLAASWIEPRLDSYRLTVLDVGQGQCIVLQKGGQTYLVDCGGDRADDAALTAMRYLYSQCIFQIDGLVLTHFDDDHAAGAEALMSLMDVDRLYLPDAEPDNSIRKNLLAEQWSKIHFVRREQSIALDDGKITIYPALAGETGNNSSLCILFQAENCDILITGDRSRIGEQMLMDQTDLPDLEILVAGHHGAGSSSGLPLLMHTQPEIVLISVGKDNPFGHPDPETLRRLAWIGCRVLRTDLQGTILIRG